VGGYVAYTRGYKTGGDATAFEDNMKNDTLGNLQECLGLLVAVDEVMFNGDPGYRKIENKKAGSRLVLAKLKAVLRKFKESGAIVDWLDVSGKGKVVETMTDKNGRKWIPLEVLGEEMSAEYVKIPLSSFEKIKEIKKMGDGFLEKGWTVSFTEMAEIAASVLEEQYKE
jgi:hypothetical protein